MNQLISFEDMSLEQLKEIEAETTKRKVQLLESDLSKVKSTVNKVESKVGFVADKIDQVESMTTQLKEHMIADPSAVQEIIDAGQRKVIETLGGMESPAYGVFSRKLFQRFWSRYKTYMSIPNRKYTRAKDYDKAMEWISQFKPHEEEEAYINQLNGILPDQIRMEV
jgi:hypothetical protein